MYEPVFDSAPHNAQARFRSPSAGLVRAADGPVFGGSRQAHSSSRHWKYPAVAISLVLLAVLAFLVVRWFDSYTVRATLQRAAPDSSESLLSGDRIASGDRLYLEFEGSAPLFAYILSRDAQGKAYLLFPLSGYDLSNPIPPGQVAHLPGAMNGTEVFWQVTGRSAREYFLIVTALHRLVDFEKQLQLTPSGQETDTVTPVPVPESAMQVLADRGGLPSYRGSGHRVTETERIFQQAATVSARAERTHGVWIRRIVLENPEAGLFGPD